MARQRTLHVQDRDAETWDRAQQLAYEDRISLSGLVAQLLEQWLAERSVSTGSEEAKLTAQAAS